MGRRYQSELRSITATIDWANKQEIASLRHTLLRDIGRFNLVAIGSGGSLVAAAFAAMLHEEVTGRLARFTTPLEAMIRKPPRDTAALLLSASGSNTDILQVARRLPLIGYESIAAVSTRNRTRLRATLSERGGIAHEFPIPTGRDGFLATNSLMATMMLLYRATFEECKTTIGDNHAMPTKPKLQGPESALMKKTIIVLAQGWALPAAMDFESRFSEAALANVSVSDPRNFAHGRHNWLTVHAANTGIVSLETLDSEREATRMLGFLPEEIEVLRVKTEQEGPEATIDLVAAVMRLAGQSALERGIDPGRPSVPNYGRRLFRAGSAQLPVPRRASPIIKKRKAFFVNRWENRENVEIALRNFVERLKTTSFSGLAIDYDGTLCSRSRRCQPMSTVLCTELNRLLAEDVLVAIASGRGGSLYELLRKGLRSEFWDRVILGLYNGAKVITLTDDFPESTVSVPKILENSYLRIRPLETALNLSVSLNSHQISIRTEDGMDPSCLRRVIVEQLAGLGDVSVRSSAHSVDVVTRTTSKTAVVDALRKRRPGCVLRIGDQGAAGGNDFDLLNTGLSLSVDRVSSNLLTCWNLSPSGISGPALTLQYLKALYGSNGTLLVDTTRPPFNVRF